MRIPGAKGKNPVVLAGGSVAAGVVLVLVAALLAKRYCNRNPPPPPERRPADDNASVPDNQLVEGHAGVNHDNRLRGENQPLLISASGVSYAEESVARSGKDLNIRKGGERNGLNVC